MRNELDGLTVFSLQRFGIRKNLRTGQIGRLPVLVLSPHSRCNCRCMMCDIWRANANGVELTESDIAPHVAALKKLKVRTLVLSGGEALMHKNLWLLCETLKPLRADITLLSTGLLLARHAAEIVRHCKEVIVSLDGSPNVHDTIRNIPRAYEKLAAGVAAVQACDPRFRITARCVLQRENFRDLANIVDTAAELGLQQISFLGADVSTEAFNRPGGWDEAQTSRVALDVDEADEFAALLRQHKDRLVAGHRQGLIAESFEKLQSIADYYMALNAKREFPPVLCNAPWVSAVIDADGSVRPCFFHPAYGKLADGNVSEVLNQPSAIAFRNSLDVSRNAICRRCVCSLNL